MNEEQIFAIERPHPKLLSLYLVRSIFALPLFPIVFPVLYFRYHTMRFRFDDEGIGMRWGILFRREVNLTYARIQDIHLTSGILQRWFGLADIHIQTASGSAEAEMTIEGLLEFEAIRDFLYSKMRGEREGSHRARTAPAAPAGAAAPSLQGVDEAQLVSLLTEIREDIRGTREAIERLSGQGGSPHV